MGLGFLKAIQINRRLKVNAYYLIFLPHNLIHQLASGPLKKCQWGMCVVSHPGIGSIHECQCLSVDSPSHMKTALRQEILQWTVA